METLSAMFAVCGILTTLAVAVLLAVVLVHQWKWSSSALSAMNSQAEHARWFRAFSENLVEILKRLDGVESANSKIAEAIYSVPTSVRSRARDELDSLLSSSRSPQGPAPGSIEIPDEKDIRAAIEATNPTTPRETPLERVVGKPI